MKCAEGEGRRFRCFKYLELSWQTLRMTRWQRVTCVFQTGLYITDILPHTTHLQVTMANNNRSAFHIAPTVQYSTTPGTIKRPVEIACFSYDEEHEYHDDARSMRYYYTPPMNVPLSAGFDTFRNLDVTEDEHLEALLRTLQSLEKRTGEAVEADFITWRGMCTKVGSVLVQLEI